MRAGNFFFELPLPEALVVHRGVSQGGRKISADDRWIFWQKNAKEVPGVDINNGKVTVSLPGLRTLREKNLVIVSNPGKPRIWTVKRITESSTKTNHSEQSALQGASKRQGGLKL
jgi:hypothetical protein